MWLYFFKLVQKTADVRVGISDGCPAGVDARRAHSISLIFLYWLHLTQRIQSRSPSVHAAIPTVSIVDSPQLIPVFVVPYSVFSCIIHLKVGECVNL